jgi:hypothetical protein
VGSVADDGRFAHDRVSHAGSEIAAFGGVASP